MARKVKVKELKNARILKEYASWIYCTGCEKTVAYLCYVTYSAFRFDFKCNCGCEGNVNLEIDDDVLPKKDNRSLILKKNRLCCPEDESPFITFVDKNLSSYTCDIVCTNCSSNYRISKE